MSSQPSMKSIPDECADQAAPPRGLPIGRVVLGTLVLALVGWTVMRVRTAQNEQARLLAERTQAAEAAKKERTEKPLVLRAGVPASWLPLVRIEGTLLAVEEADLSFKVTGRLQSIRAKVGDYVRKGQVLAVLEQTESAASVEQANAQVRAAEASLKLAEDTEQRTSTLVSSGAGSAQSALQTREQRALAQAQADAAKAGLSLAQANLANAQLVSPFNGYVTKVPSGAGQVVQPGAVLFHVQNTTSLRLVGSVSESEAGLVQVGEPLRVLAADRAIAGTVTAVLGSVDAATRRVPVEARVPNDPKQPLLAGTYVRAEVEGKKALPVLRFPAGVIRPGSQNEVMVAESGRMQARRVVFHPSSTGDGMIFVRAGLEASDQVVVDPSPEAHDGDPLPAGSQAAK
jgi:RND family efflux transporter MFP subunit